MPWGWLHVTGHEHAPCVRDVVSPANAESPGRSGCCVICPNEAQARQYVTRIARQSGYRPAYGARDCGRHRERPILPRIPGAGVPMECAPPLAVPQPDGGRSRAGQGNAVDHCGIVWWRATIHALLRSPLGVVGCARPVPVTPGRRGRSAVALRVWHPSCPDRTRGDWGSTMPAWPGRGSVLNFCGVGVGGGLRRHVGQFSQAFVQYVNCPSGPSGPQIGSGGKFHWVNDQ